jgi:hypothetical protein
MTTTVITFKPKAPKMGGLFQVLSTDWCAWTGGKHLYDWSTLDQIVAKEPNNNSQYRPSSPGSSQKVGLETKFKCDDHLLDFTDVIAEYFLHTGLDHLLDFTDVIEEYFLHTGLLIPSRTNLIHRIPRSCSQSSNTLQSLIFKPSSMLADSCTSTKLTNTIAPMMTVRLRRQLDADDWTCPVNIFQLVSSNQT